MNVVFFLVLIVVLVVFFGVSSRARRRQAAQQAEQADRITVGTDVMTTSGLHGTVVVVNDDDTVQLSIAPGVEVRWEVAALRDLASLPPRYRRDAEPDEPLDADGPQPGDPAGSAAGGDTLPPSADPPSKSVESSVDLTKDDRDTGAA